MDEHDRAWRERGLKEAVLAGDERAWRCWYAQTCDDLYRYVLWRCGGLRDHADEVVQDTWLTAVRRLGSFDPDQGPWRDWLRGIAANLLRNRFRRDARRRAVGQPRPEGFGEPADAPLLRREQAEQVASALASLPSRYEEALRARYLEGLPVAEVAQALGVSFKSAESLLSRAREAFRHAFECRE